MLLVWLLFHCHHLSRLLFHCHHSSLSILCCDRCCCFHCMSIHRYCPSSTTICHCRCFFSLRLPCYCVSNVAQYFPPQCCVSSTVAMLLLLRWFCYCVDSSIVIIIVASAVVLLLLLLSCCCCCCCIDSFAVRLLLLSLFSCCIASSVASFLLLHRFFIATFHLFVASVHLFFLPLMLTTFCIASSNDAVLNPLTLPHAPTTKMTMEFSCFAVTPAIMLYRSRNGCDWVAILNPFCCQSTNLVATAFFQAFNCDDSINLIVVMMIVECSILDRLGLRSERWQNNMKATRSSIASTMQHSTKNSKHNFLTGVSN